MSDTKIRSYEIFTENYSVIIQAKSLQWAVDYFCHKYSTNRANIIMAIDCDFFKLSHKFIIEKKKYNAQSNPKN